MEVITNDHTIDVIVVDYDSLDKEEGRLAEEKLNSLDNGEFQNTHLNDIEI